MSAIKQITNLKTYLKFNYFNPFKLIGHLWYTVVGKTLAVFVQGAGITIVVIFRLTLHIFTRRK